MEQTHSPRDPIDPFDPANDSFEVGFEKSANLSDF